MFMGFCGFLFSHFGHDRAKNDLGIEFPHPSCELLGFAACMQWLVFRLCWSVNEGWSMLDKPCVWEPHRQS